MKNRTHGAGASPAIVMQACCLLLLALLTAACSPAQAPADNMGNEAEPPTNRIEIPPAVVRNLGITFANVERRRVEQTLRLAGAFESPPEAEREYRALLAGRVTLHVSEYSRVEQGQPIASLDSPQWREIQRGLEAADAAVAEAKALLAEAETRVQSAEVALSLFPRRLAAYQPQLDALDEHRRTLALARDGWQARATELAGLVEQGAGRAGELAEARAQAAAAEAELSAQAEKRAELERAIAELSFEQQRATANLPTLNAEAQTAQSRVDGAARAFSAALRAAETATGSAAQSFADGAWRDLQVLVIRAAAPGTVVDVHAREGAWVEAGAAICRSLDASRLRFRARALQSDLARLRDGLRGRVTFPGHEAIEGEIALAPVAAASSRLIDVMLDVPRAPAWARAGISAELEVVWDETATAELAVPARAIVRDGLQHVFFLRESIGAPRVIRVEAEIGPSDGRWTVVYSGPMEGDEVVVDGAYELNLAGGGPQGGGHFHADGTWHADDH